MTVKELVELNQMITDVDIEVRVNGTTLLDAVYIGYDRGAKPTYPIRVPKKPEYINNPNRTHDDFYKDAAYIRKSMNAWEDGKDYWQVKVKTIPAKYLDLEVFSWEVWSASRIGWGRRWYTDGGPNNNFHGQRINIVALPGGQQKTIPEPEKKPKKDDLVDDNQMTIDDWMEANA